MLDVQEIEEETLFKIEDGSHVKLDNRSTELTQTQQIKKISAEYNESKCINPSTFSQI